MKISYDLSPNFWKTNAQRFSTVTVLDRAAQSLLLSLPVKRARPRPPLTGHASRRAGQQIRKKRWRLLMLPLENIHAEDRQGLTAQTDNDKKDKPPLRESSKVISVFILPFSHMWAHSFLLKNGMIHETHLPPLIFTIFRGHMAVFCEDLHRSFNPTLQYEILDLSKLLLKFSQMPDLLACHTNVSQSILQGTPVV